MGFNDICKKTFELRKDYGVDEMWRYLNEEIAKGNMKRETAQAFAERARQNLERYYGK